MLEYLSVISERQEREIRANNTVVNQGINPVNTLPQWSSKRMAEYVVTHGERLYVVLKCYVVRKSSRKSSVDVLPSSRKLGVEEEALKHLLCPFLKNTLSRVRYRNNARCHCMAFYNDKTTGDPGSGIDDLQLFN